MNLNDDRIAFNGPSLQALFRSPAMQVSPSSDPPNAVEEKWLLLVDKATQRASRILLFSTLYSLPAEIATIYDEIEAKTGQRLDMATRKMYYEEFTSAASERSVLHATEIEIILRAKMRLNLESDELEKLIWEKVNASDAIPGEEEGMVDFELFVSIICEISQRSALHGDEKQKKVSFWDVSRYLPLDPDSRGKQAWDILCLLLLLYCSFYVPYSIAFINGESEDMTPVDFSNLCIDALFLLDIALTFVTTCDHQGVMVKDFRKIANIYFVTWFWPDFAGSFPFDAVITAALESRGGSNVSNLGALKIIRLLKLVRAIKFIKQLNKLKQRDNMEFLGTFLSLLSSVFLLIFTAHVLGCFFTLFIALSPEANWLIKYDPDLMEADDAERYLTALYWAIISVTTMGYGDITPKTSYERLFSILVALIGAVVFSQCMGTVASLITQVTGVDDRYQIRSKSVAEWLQYREIPADVKRRVRHYYNNCWRRSPAPYDESEILDELSTPVKELVLRSLSTKVISEVPILLGFDDCSMGLAYSLLKREMFLEGEHIYKRGDIGAEMFFIVSGSVKLQWPGISGAASKSSAVALVSTPTGNMAGTDELLNGGRNFRTAGRGDTFGEVALFPEILGRRRTETALAETWVTGYSLSIEKLQVLRDRCPDMVAKLRELCELRALECRAMDPSLKDAPGVVGSMSVAKQRKIQSCIEQLKADLLRDREARLLTNMAVKDAGGERPILRLLLPSEKDKTSAGLQHVSMAITAEGELVCVEHSLEGLGRNNALSLGFLVPGMSTVRVLRKEEVLVYNNWNKRQLFGCAVVVFDSKQPVQIHKGPTKIHAKVFTPTHPVNTNDYDIDVEALVTSQDSAAAHSNGTEKSTAFENSVRRLSPDDDSGHALECGGRQISLLTWSQEDFGHLRKSLGERLSAMAATAYEDARAVDKDQGAPIAGGESGTHMILAKSSDISNSKYTGDEASLRQRLEAAEREVLSAREENERLRRNVIAALLSTARNDHSSGTLESAAATNRRSGSGLGSFGKRNGALSSPMPDPGASSATGRAAHMTHAGRGLSMCSSTGAPGVSLIDGCAEVLPDTAVTQVASARGHLQSKDKSLLPQGENLTRHRSSVGREGWFSLPNETDSRPLDELDEAAGRSASPLVMLPHFP